MNKWWGVIGFLIFFSIYLTFQIFSEQRKLLNHYIDKSAKLDSTAEYYFVKYVKCKGK